MDILLTNTLTGKKEKFEPCKKGLFGRPKVGMYHCGPTVYHYPHIGNLRAYVFADTLKRLMRANGFKIKQVINITDVGHLVSDADTGEDKMEKAREREHKSAYEIANFYTNVFMENLADLNIDTIGTKFTRATKYIKQQIALIKKLEKNGFTYKTSDGIYFDTSKFPTYGKLGNIDLKGLREGERIGVNEEKKNLTDFALWKFSPKDKKREMEWPSPWGVGFPGWHIECSAMSMAFLGETFDIHTGGIDHIPVHHQNEIAQSEGATGKPFVKYWMHSAFLNIDGGKMAKSDDNFLTLTTIKEKGFSPMDYRYLLLTARYSTPLSFTWEALESAHNAYKKLVSTLIGMPDGGRPSKLLWEQALALLGDDLDTAKVIALIWNMFKDPSHSPADQKATILKIDSLLGLNLKRFNLSKSQKLNLLGDIPPEITSLLKDRESARTSKDFKRSDELRDKIKSLGFEVKDTPEGQKVSRS